MAWHSVFQAQLGPVTIGRSTLALTRKKTFDDDMQAKAVLVRLSEYLDLDNPADMAKLDSLSRCSFRYLSRE